MQRNRQNINRAASGRARRILAEVDTTPRDLTGRPVTLGREYRVTSGPHAQLDVMVVDMLEAEPERDAVIVGKPLTDAMPSNRLVGVTAATLIPIRFTTQRRLA